MASLALLLASLAYTAYWIQLFPEKARLGATLSTELPTAETAASHPLAVLYPAIFLPPDYGSWWREMATGFPPLYLAAGLLVWPLLYFAARRRSPGSIGSRAVLFGGLWPAVTILPLLALSGGVDLFRLGLLAAFGFGLSAAAVGHRSAWFAVLAPVALAPWLGRSAISSCEAWGPGGFMMTLGTRWKAESVDWQDSIDPEMKRLFLEQIHERTHAGDWVRHGATK
jgi:hypothetical protein